MTIAEAIQKADALVPNAYTQSEKVSWLSTADAMVDRFIIQKHEDAGDPFGGYNDETPTDTVLLVGEPFEELYLHYIESKIAYYNGEYGRYNNAVMRYNETYRAFADDYNQAHRPLTEKMRFF